MGQGGFRVGLEGKVRALAKRHMMGRPALMTITRIVFMVSIRSKADACGHDWRHIVVFCGSIMAHVTDFTACEKMHSNKYDPCHLGRSRYTLLYACLPSRHSLCCAKWGHMQDNQRNDVT